MRIISSAVPASSPWRCYRRLLFCVLFLISIQISKVSGGRIIESADSNPFTPKSYLLRYWKKQIGNDLPKPAFLLEKASPLTAADYAIFSKIAGDGNALSAKLPEFCAKARLLCFPDLSPSLEKHDSDADFANYVDQNFTSYGNGRLKGTDSFQKYSEDDNVVLDTFRRYSRGSTGHNDEFGAYGTRSNVVEQRFNTYGTGATGGEGQFGNYGDEVNAPNLRFISYSDGGNSRNQQFTTYSNQANAGDEGFTSYGKKGNGAGNTFTSYGNQSNVIGSNFRNYGEDSNAANDQFTSYGQNGNAPANNFRNYGEAGNGASEQFTSYGENGNVLGNNFRNYGGDGNGASDNFTSYGDNGNVPENNFNTYGASGSSAIDTFKNYRNQSNVGDDSFDSYGKGSKSSELGFVNYGQSFNDGSDKFTGYGKDATAATVDFKIYGVNNTFKEYNKDATTTFSSYQNASSPISTSVAAKKVNRWVEPGKFFREAMLKQGTLMPMPDIRDKMPKRSFLPRAIVSKLPFSSSKFSEIKKIFHSSDDSSISKMAKDALHDCERAPSPGETKWCVASIEDMIDFATSVLDRSVAVRTTDSTAGANSQILVGEVKGINGGKVTKSVSCHQSLYPYLLYYCHSVPKVRVYEADILDPKTKSKINHGVAICHLDTSSWSPDHGAFVALGPSPGKIEVCHWIFENDMTWAVAD